MINRSIINKQRSAFLAMSLLLVAPFAANAQDVAPTFEPATIILTTADGEEREYQVSDVSVYVSTTAGYEGVPASTDFSLSLSTMLPVDAELLQWASQTGGKTKQPRDVAITAMVGSAEGEEREMRYDITGAEVTSVSVTHSTYAQPSVSLSLIAGKLTIDGVAMN